MGLSLCHRICLTLKLHSSFLFFGRGWFQASSLAECQFHRKSESPAMNECVSEIPYLGHCRRKTIRSRRLHQKKYENLEPGSCNDHAEDHYVLTLVTIIFWYRCGHCLRFCRWHLLESITDGFPIKHFVMSDDKRLMTTADFLEEHPLRATASLTIATHFKVPIINYSGSPHRLINLAPIDLNTHQLLLLVLFDFTYEK